MRHKIMVEHTREGEPSRDVIPAQAGIQEPPIAWWTLAFAGVTRRARPLFIPLEALKKTNAQGAAGTKRNDRQDRQLIADANPSET